MMTKEEFIEKWLNSDWLIRRIFIGDVCLFADDFHLLDNEVRLSRNEGVFARIKYELITKVD